jgi:hypothetical protein
MRCKFDEKANVQGRYQNEIARQKLIIAKATGGQK